MAWRRGWTRVRTNEGRMRIEMAPPREFLGSTEGKPGVIPRAGIKPGPCLLFQRNEGRNRMSECRHCHEGHWEICDTIECLESSLKTVTSDLETTRSALATAKAEIERLRTTLEFYEAGNEWDYGRKASHALSQGEAERLSATIEADILKSIGAEKLVGSVYVNDRERAKCIDPESPMEAHDREVRNRALEEAAGISDGWAKGATCFDQHEDNPCCHVRLAITISEKIRALRSEPSKGQGEIPK